MLITFRVPNNLLANIKSNKTLPLLGTMWNVSTERDNKGTYFLACAEANTATLNALTNNGINAVVHNPA